MGRRQENKDIHLKMNSRVSTNLEKSHLRTLNCVIYTLRIVQYKLTAAGQGHSLKQREE